VIPVKRTKERLMKPAADLLKDIENAEG